MSKGQILNLSTQNILLKFVFLIFSLIMMFFLKTCDLLLFLLTALLFFSFFFPIITGWLRTTAKLSFFFSSLLLLGLIFKIEFPHQIDLIMKILYFLLISSYFLNTVPTYKTQEYVKDNFISSSAFYLQAVLYFLPFLAQKISREFKSPGNVPDKINNILMLSYQEFIQQNRLDLQPYRIDLHLHKNDIYLVLLMLVQLSIFLIRTRS
ncbi:MAG: hypothetical protein JXB60_09875 [Candidatus Cloacimonetes bacterium]|nr:hypothetical protein [Candidatus Cloacimonadota bacterium]